jgi:Rhamnogalacturonan lyase family 11, C-terminal domain
LEIFSTIIPATSRMYTLMHDPQYREAIAWQNSGYNQPPHPGFFLGAGMAAPPAPDIYFAPQLVGDYNGDDHVDSGDYVLWRKTLGSMTNLQADGNHDGIVDSGDEQVWRANFGAVGPAGASVAASMIGSQSIGGGLSSNSGALSALSGVPTSDGRDESFARLQVSRLSGTGALVDQKADLTLVLLNGSGPAHAQDRTSGSRPPGNREVGNCHTTAQSADGGSDAFGSALALMSKRDFLLFTKKFQ